MSDSSLSQDEIDALLMGAEDIGGDTGGGASPAAGGGGDDLGQAELTVLNKLSTSIVNVQSSSLSGTSMKDTQMSVTSAGLGGLSEALTGMDGAVINVKVGYTSPVNANVFFLLKEDDAKALAEIMQGSAVEDMDEMAMSAVTEAFNQMLGAMDTQIGSEYSINLENSGPKLSKGNLPGDVIIPDGQYYSIRSSIKIEDSIDSEWLMLFPVNMAKAMASGGSSGGMDSSSGLDSLLGDAAAGGDSNNIQSAEFSQLTPTAGPETPNNISLLLDVPMEMTVELGRSVKTVQEVLSLGEGSIIELDKLAGEPVDLLVNGKPIAKGEVVVIDENFGVRVTEIVSLKSRISNNEE